MSAPTSVDMDAYVRRLVDSAPPFSREQTERLFALLGGAGAVPSELQVAS